MTEREAERAKIRTEIKEALAEMGYGGMDALLVPYGTGRVAVLVGGERLGIWDAKKKAFID